MENLWAHQSGGGARGKAKDRVRQHCPLQRELIAPKQGQEVISQDPRVVGGDYSVCILGTRLLDVIGLQCGHVSVCENHACFTVAPVISSSSIVISSLPSHLPFLSFPPRIPPLSPGY